MARVVARKDPALSIAPGKLPDMNSPPWWSDDDGTGGTSGLGHAAWDGYHPDELVIHFQPTAWGAVTGVELLVQRCTDPTGQGAGARWSYVEPAAEVAGGPTPDLDTTGGRVVIKPSLATGDTIALRVKVPGAKRLRVGLRNAGSG